MKLRNRVRWGCSVVVAVVLLVISGCTHSSNVPPGNMASSSIAPASAGTAASSVAIPPPSAVGLAPATPAATSTSAPAAVSGNVGTLSAAGQSVIDKPEYAGARWTYQVSDMDTGKVLLSKEPRQLVFTASTGKFFTVGSLFANLGPTDTLKTPVYTTGHKTGKTLDGNVVLVASGDIALGGRGAMQGRMDQSFSAATIDHVYGDVAPTGSLTPDDPLAGLNSLARQVKATGITTVNGDVLIDDRLWEPFASQEGPVPAIFVNDNIFDISVTGGNVGGVATITERPTTHAFQVRSKVVTGAANSTGRLEVEADPADSRRLTVSGSIPAGKSQLTIYRIPDASTWARTLFIEALQRAGISVKANPLRDNNSASLPKKGSYSAGDKVASLTSPSLATMSDMIMQTSYNRGANAMMCLLAVKVGSTNCLDGLKLMHQTASKAGLSPADTLLFDGQGADPESSTPAEMVKYLTWAKTQSWGQDLEGGLPIFGVSGSLASVGITSPAKGEILAKTGTSGHLDRVTGRLLIQTYAYAGYMTTATGRKLVFDVSLNAATFPDLDAALIGSGHDLADVAEAIWTQFS
ncbi:MAG: D-alanyl-D-alanine carboxypeptidase/D-alanyl-D-alanine endopeptidase [Nakamurella sp.]